MHHTLSELSNIEAEQAVLGAVMIKPDCLSELTTILSDSDFYRETHAIVFRTMKAMLNEMQVIDLVSLTEYVRRSGDLDRIGGLPFLTQLANSVPTAANVIHHAKIVKDYARKRRGVQIGQELVNAMYRGDEATEDTIASTQTMLAKTVSDNALVLHSPQDTLLEILGDVGKEPTDAMLTGFGDLDRMLNGGLKRKWLYIIAGRTSVGKSAFTGNIIDNVCAAGYRVLLFSLEMDRKRIWQRFLARRASVPLNLVKNNMIGATEEQLNHYYAAAERMTTGHKAKGLSKYHLEIDDMGYQSISTIRSKTMAIQAKYGLDLMVIDHLQIMKFDKAQDRNNSIGDVCSQLHALAVDLDIPIIIVSQLSREVTKRNDKIPHMQDLRDSGNIEQDADAVIFIHRDRYYDQEGYDRKNGPFDPGKGEKAVLNVDKNRDGETGLIPLRWFGQYQAFVSGSTREEPVAAQQEPEKPTQYTLRQADRVGKKFSDK